MESFAAPIAGASDSVAATASSIQGTITMAKGLDGLHIANTSATLYVPIRVGTSAQTAILGDSLTIPPLGQVLVETPRDTQIAHVAAIGSAAGPTAVVFTPVRLRN